MSSGVTPTVLRSIVVKLINTAFVTFLVTSGLLMSPVTCMCGASIPHGHSLFQLPFHNHASADQVAHEPDSHAGHEHGAGIAPDTLSQEAGCDDVPGKTHDHPDAFSYAARSNAREKHDGAVLQAPPNSSIGHPVAMMQPASIALPGQQSESLTLPPARVMEGLEHSPETPPPRSTMTA